MAARAWSWPGGGACCGAGPALAAPVDAELLVFDTYVKLGFDLPALIPQVYFHYDPYGGGSRLPRQRMDFLLRTNQRARAVIQVDGMQHYVLQVDEPSMRKPGPVWLADPEQYAVMVAQDRQLAQQGYEIYRIGRRELRDP